jgi:HTH-type transcriptional regulator, competence development regulator
LATVDQPVDETFGKHIQRLRRERGLTQREVATKLEIDFTYLSKIENDRGEAPGEETVRKLAEVLDADVEELLALAGRVPPELRKLAQENVEFARFLRRLPNVSDKDLQDLYQKLKDSTPTK